MKNEKLFTDFPPVSAETWKEKIITDLKGADYKKKLVWQTDEGFEVQPFYRKEDIQHTSHMSVLPGEYPFIRGTKAKANDWLVRQDISVSDPNETNAKLLDIRMKGVDAFGLVYQEGYVPTENEVEQLLANIRADVMELNFSCNDPYSIIQILDHLVKKYNRDLTKIKGSLDYCPLSRYSTTGAFYVSEEEDFKTLKKLFVAGNLLPNFQLVTVNGSVFQNAGAGIVHELAFALAMASEYLTFLTEKGFDIDEVAPRFRFHFSVGSNYFLEIAKFRAARFLWAKIVNAYGVSDASITKTFIHGSNSRWNKTMYDPYVNMLRTTTETMSAILGGVDSFSVLPFDQVFTYPDEFSERIARNQQLILKEESFFNKVADPASGSYYVEKLTEKIIKEAWERFLQVDEKGGYLQAFKQGFVQQCIREEAEKKNMDIAMRKKSLLGTNQYPNITEKMDAETLGSEDQRDDQISSGFLTPYRGAEAFEAIRLKMDQYALTHKRPVVWMFTYGNLAMRRARAQFASNFFGVAGFDIQDNPGFSSVDEGVKAATDAQPDIVVICSSDEEYEDIAISVYKALKDHFIVVLAGYPKDLVNELAKNGLKQFIHIRSNVLEQLQNYQRMLGII